MHSATDERIDIIERFYRLDVDSGCPVHIAAAVVAPDVRGVKRVVSGRGRTAEDAISRCLSEAIERHSAVHNRALEIIQSSSFVLATSAIDPHQLLHISDAQYSNRMEWNAQVDIAHHIPPRFDETQNISWVSANSLTSHSAKFVPAAYCFLGYPKALEEGFPIPDSSGLAAGNSTVDAVGRGLLELIERDAVSMWWYNRLVMPPLEFDHGALPLWQPFMDWIARCGRKFWLLDLTNDLGVPVAAAISCDQLGGDLSIGFAAAHNPERAAENAMGELVQFEATKKYHIKSLPETYPHFLSWCQAASISDHSFIVPSTSNQKLALTLPASTQSILERLASKGLEAYALEFASVSQHTKAVRVIVPGLRPIWRRLAAGRLYDVPYELGLVKFHLLETDLNPIPILY